MFNPHKLPALPPILSKVHVTATNGETHASASAPSPQPASASASHPPPDPQLRRRESQRGMARIFGASSSKTTLSSSVGEVNDAARAHLEKILGMSLTPKNAEEANALHAALDREIAGLSDFSEKIQEFKEANKQPNRDISELDEKYCDHVLAMETVRHPDLDAQHFNDAADFVAHLKDHLENGGPLPRRVLVRSGAGDPDGPNYTVHHVAIDVAKIDGKLSLLPVDPVSLAAPLVQNGIEQINSALQALAPHPYAWSYTICNAMSSEHDCLPFGMTYMKKFLAAQPLMDELHRKQLSGEAFHEANPENVFQDMEDSVMAASTNLHQISTAGHEFLPLGFFKHSQSPRTADELLEARPEEANTLVNKTKEDQPDRPGRPAQTLRQRIESHIPEEGRRKGLRVLKYSLSIEEKRADTVKKTLDLFKDLKASVPTSF